MNETWSVQQMSFISNQMPDLATEKNESETDSMVIMSATENQTTVTSIDQFTIQEEKEYFLENPEKFFYDASSRTIITVIMPIILATGIVANCAFIYIIIRLKRMRTVTNFYLANLAIADLIYLCIVVGDKLLRYFTSPFSKDYSSWGQQPCKLITALIFVPHFVSELTISLFTYERYIATKNSRRTLYKKSKLKCLLYIVVTWFLSGLLITPCLYFINGKTFILRWIEEGRLKEKTIRKCGPLPITLFGGLTLQCHALQTVPFFFSAVIIIVLNTLIIKALNKSAVSSRNLFSQDHKAMADRKQIVRMLIATSAIFYICVLPYYVDDIINALVQVKLIAQIKLPAEFLQTGRFLAYSNSALNILVYNIFSRRYRQAFYQAYCCRRVTSPSTRSTITQSFWLEKKRLQRLQTKHIPNNSEHISTISKACEENVEGTVEEEKKLSIIKEAEWDSDTMATGTEYIPVASESTYL